MSKVYKLSGPPEHWLTAISKGYWGFTKKNKQKWDQIERGMVCFFHSTGRGKHVPSAVVGYGIVGEGKYKKSKPWWFQEFQKKDNWQYVFPFSEVYVHGDVSGIDFYKGIQDKDDSQIQSEIRTLSQSGIPLGKLIEEAKKLGAPGIGVQGSFCTLNPAYEKLLLHSQRKWNSYSSIQAHWSDEEFAEASYNAEPITLPPGPISKPNKVKASRSEKYSRSDGVSADAHKKANFICEVNATHTTFCSKAKEMPYVEPHHLIPISRQDDFDFSIDVPENIISLCPNCHRLIHYAMDKDKKSLLIRFYKQRRDRLKDRGISISLKRLFSYYNIQ